MEQVLTSNSAWETERNPQNYGCDYQHNFNDGKNRKLRNIPIMEKDTLSAWSEERNNPPTLEFVRQRRTIFYMNKEENPPTSKYEREGEPPTMECGFL